MRTPKEVRNMARFASLAHITFTSYAACLVLVACGDGATDDPGSPGGGNAPNGGSAAQGGTATSAGTTSAGTTSAGTTSAGTSSNVSGSGSGGTPSGGQPSSAGTESGGRAGSSGAAGTAASGSSNGGSPNGGSGGTSPAPECDDDEDLCAGKCVDLEEDAKNCGSCGKACGNQQECNSGECECTGDLELCSNACVNPDTDEQNCGGCGKKCSSGQTCESGTCTGGGTAPVTACSSITDFGVVSTTIVVKNGQTFDGKCQRYRADPNTLGDGTQDEDQKPVFIVEGGGRLINLVLGAPAADGIHTKGDVTLENITWEDIGEDAMTIKESGTVVLNGGSAKNGDDKVFQVNAASTFRISNFKAQNAGKFIRQNGDTTFKVQVFIDKCDISDMDEAIFRTDSSTSTVSMTNTRYSNIGDSLFLGVASGNITQSGNTQY
jgi:Pectate lyase/Stigma-specific protein, Stig1